MTPFDFIKKMTSKSPLPEISDDELKDCSPFLINRFLSTNEMLTKPISDINHIALSLSKRQYLKLMWYLLPKRYFKLNFPKKDKSNIDDKIIEQIKKKYICSESMAKQYYDIMKYQDTLKDFVSQFGTHK